MHPLTILFERQPGRNAVLFANIDRMRHFIESIWGQIKGRAVRWLLPAEDRAPQLLAWTQAGAAAYIFVVNRDPSRSARRFTLPQVDARQPALKFVFSTTPNQRAETLVWNGFHYFVSQIGAGEGRVYRVEPPA